MTESNVAQDQIKAYVDRILRMKEEADAIAADIREIYAEAKSNGFDKTQLGNLVTYLRKKDKDAEKVAEGEAIFDLYLTAYLGASGKVGTRRATHTHAPEKPDPIAALRADPAMAIVDVANLKKSEPQPTKAAGSDLTTPQALNGQVATHSPETANEGEEATTATASGESPASAGEKPSPSEGGENVDTPDVSATQTPQDVTGKSVEAPASAAPAAKYAAPGIVTYENHPPEGVSRSPISIAFGNMGQDGALIQDDLANGRSQPIVKQGNVILDGWARYMTARTMTELDGSPLTYAVVQYDGTDPLIDVIRWNVEGRMLNEQQKRVIAQTLTRQHPKRKDDITKAFELWMEPV